MNRTDWLYANFIEAVNGFLYSTVQIWSETRRHADKDRQATEGYRERRVGGV